jgi:hypothetical protein
VRCSELELEGELDRAGTADLAERIEAAIGAARAEAAGQRLRRMAKQGAGEGVVGSTPPAVVATNRR